MSSDITQTIVEQVRQSKRDKTPLCIQGSGSHDFMLSDYDEDQVIDMNRHHGIVDYQPTELTITARAGTPLREIQETLAKNQQRLATDVPSYSVNATLGGAIAMGHTGSGRPFLGGIRDHVLGARLVNGQGEELVCGGQVMKNVAGYDIARLLCGSRGTLGPILDISLKVLPAPEQQLTITFNMDENQAIENMNRMAGLSLPISACVFHDRTLYVRLEGTQSGLSQAVTTLGGDSYQDSENFWQSIQQQSHDFFTTHESLWRIIVPSTTARLELENNHFSLIDWCGGLRWIHSAEISQSDFIHVTNCDGYIENFRVGTPTAPADLMSPLLRNFHQKIKTAFDPYNLFNPKLSCTF